MTTSDRKAGQSRQSVSMNDVAREAGVSLKTVSRVVNEPAAVREATRVRVEEAMDRLGFRANFAARSLKLGRYRSIGLALYRITGGNLSVLDGITTAAAEHGYAITLIKRRQGEELTLSEASHRLSSLPVDGMIFILNQMVEDFEAYRAPADLKTVIVTPLAHPTCSTVSDDQQGSARLATEHLLAHGHRTVRFIAGRAGSLSNACRQEGWRQALEAAGAPVEEPLSGDWTADAGWRAGRELASDPACTAILAANDAMAYGALLALRDAGRRVPEDVSVIGIDDALAETVPNLDLTSVRFRHGELGVRAFSEVVNGLASPSSRARILVPGELVERGTVGMAR